MTAFDAQEPNTGGGGGANEPSALPVPIAEGGTASTTAALARTALGVQPVDSDLTAIAALTTTAYGRALLELANAAAGRTALGLGTAATAASGDFQPADSDLTAIAALTTTVYGRAFLAMADAAAAKTALALVKADVGLGSVDNTADTAKPVSTAQQTALDLKLAASAVSAYGLTLVDDADAATARTTLGTSSLVMLANFTTPLSLGPATINRAFTDLDLSATVPAGATAALLNVMVRDSGGGPARFKIRKNGVTSGGPYGDGTVWGADENVSTYQSYHVIAPVDSSRIIEYEISGGTASCEFYVQLLGYVAP